MSASKLPDLNEVTKFTSKLFKDIKKSVTEIYSEYKSAREEDESKPKKECCAEKPKAQPAKAKSTEKKAEAKAEPEVEKKSQKK